MGVNIAGKYGVLPDFSMMFRTGSRLEGLAGRYFHFDRTS